MHIRRLTPSDWLAASAVNANAMMDDPLFAVLNPWRKQYPEHFRNGFLRRVRSGSVQPGFMVYVAVTDAEDHEGSTTTATSSGRGGDVGAKGKVVGYCVWERRGDGPDAKKWKMENAGVMNKVYATYYKLANWLVNFFKLDKSLDTQMLATYIATAGDQFSSPLFAEMWYVAALAVDPAYQRRGIGKQLLKWGIEQARQEKVPVGLEASPMGKGLYEILGFRTVRMSESINGKLTPIMVWEPEGLSAEESWFERAREKAEEKGQEQEQEGGKDGNVTQSTA